MKLDREQRSVAARIRTIARQRGASPMELLAAYQIGIVESNLRNLPGGDKDSAGWRQERASLYKDPTNLDASINRVFDEMGAVRGKYKTAGELAAAVQRPAAQYRGRYAAVSKQAQSLLGGPMAPPTVGGTLTLKPATAAKEDIDGAILDSLLSGGKRKGSLFQDVIRRVDSGEYTTPGKAAVMSEAPPALGSSGGAKARSNPRNVINMDVVPLARSLGINVTAESIAAANKRHGPTVTGGVSDHQGNGDDTWAGDFSNGTKPTKEMDEFAARIAKKYGIPWKGSGAVTFVRNGYRYQLIYRSNVGGNHFNHVHFGVKKV